MLDQPKQEAPSSTPPVEALKAEGYRSVFSVVEGWVWCPHCGLKRERTEIVPIKSVVAAGGTEPEWHAVSCVRCHARGLLSAGSAD